MMKVVVVAAVVIVTVPEDYRRGKILAVMLVSIEINS